MTWSLWRNGELIGEVVPRRTSHVQPGQVSGVLIPRAGVSLPKRVSQHSVDLGVQGAVVELLHDEHDSADRDSAHMELKRRPSGAPSGIPAEQQLSIRNAADDVVHIRAIAVHEHRIHPEQPAEEVAALPAGAIRDGSVWLVSFWLHDDTHRSA